MTTVPEGCDREGVRRQGLERLKARVGDFSLDVEFLDQCVRGLALPTDARVLDVGTGAGIMSSILALRGYRVLTGEPEDALHTDEDHPRTLHWKDTFRELGVGDRITFQHLDVLDLPFAPGSFDAAFLDDVIRHVDEKDRAIAQCLRVITDDGVVCIIEANAYAVAYYRERYGHAITPADPREHLDPATVSVEIREGRDAVLFVLRKKG